MYYKIGIALAGILLIFLACSDNHNINGPSNTIHGSGDLISETRQLPQFNSIAVNTVAHVVITRGGNQVVNVTADDNIMDFISTRVIDGVLGISVVDDVSISDFTLRLDLTVTDLEAVIVNSVATVEGNGSFDVDELYFQMNSVGIIDFDLHADEVYSANNSVGNIILSGAAALHNAAVSSVGSLHAFELETSITFVSVNSVGNAYVKASDELHAAINSTGSIYYRGDPEIHFMDNGTGRLIDAN